MPSVLWASIFLESPGYGVTENIIYQENKCAIIQEKTTIIQEVNAQKTSILYALL